MLFNGTLCIIATCDICHEKLGGVKGQGCKTVALRLSLLRSNDMPVLEANNVTKQYQMGEVSVRALDEVSFVVEKGSFVAVMGPSGSGKSTLLHLLGGLDEPTGGEITLADQPISRLSDDEVTLVRRRKVGFIFQFYNLVPTLTARENVALPLMIDGRNVKQHQAKIEELLELVGLSERMDHKPDQLSGGQQQRVAIARAFVNDPQIVLADEPTGNLDSKSGTAVLQLLRQFCDERQQTIVMVTHDPRAASYADRVAFLKDGRTVQDLTVQGSGGHEEDIRAIMRVMRELEL
jgi:putative ABC transport system ATP-binding protein